VSFAAERVTAAWCAARQAEGYRLLVADLWTGNRRVPGVEQALRLWRMAGGLTAGYVCVHDATPVETHLAEAKANAGPEWSQFRFVAVDVEVDPASAEGVLAACQLVAADGLRPVVYTARWFWCGHMGEPRSCTSYPLWDAHYGATPSLDPPGYGGWAGRIGHQYQDTTSVDGVDVDISVFDGAWVEGTPAGWVDSVPAPQDEVAQLHARWADAQHLHQQADRLHAQAAGIEQQVITRKVALGLLRA
jgi:hypothetical protein